MRPYCYLLFCFPLALFAQDETPDTLRRLQIGVGFGSMTHELDVTPSVRQESLMGESFHLALRYFDNSIVGFQAELLYSSAGWAEELRGDTAFLEELYERQIDYAELLILTQFSFGRGFLQPMLQAGPYLSFPLSETESVPAAYEPPSTAPPVYYGRPLPFRVNYGAVVGLGLNLEIGHFTVQGQGRYLIGFSDLIRTGETTASTSRRKGIGWQVGVFYAL